MLSQTSTIEIIRIQYIYSLINSCVTRTELKIAMKIPPEVNFYIYPSEKYLPNFEVISKEGKSLSILPYQYLSHILNLGEIDIETIRRIVSQTHGIPEDKMRDYYNFSVIMLPKNCSNYEELTLTWLESIEQKRKPRHLLTLTVPLKITMPVLQSSLYVDIRIDEKFQIINKPRVARIEELYYDFENGRHIIETVKEDLKEDKDYNILLDEKRHYVFRFRRELFQIIRIDCLVSIPEMIRVWSGLGTVIGGGILLSLILLTNSCNVQFFTVLSSGSIAVLIALRILLFHDIELLKRWNNLYIALILVTFLTLVITNLTHGHNGQCDLIR